MPVENINDLKNLKSLAHQFIKKFKTPQLVLLQGTLGSGKSQMVKFMCEALDCLEEAHSPAFTLINSYGKGISHIDLYRLKGREDLESTGFWDVFAHSHLVFIEWADLLEESLPSWPTLSLVFEFSSAGQRFLKWEWFPSCRD